MFGRHCRDDFLDALDGRFVAGHGVVRKERDEQQLLDSLRRAASDGVEDGRIAVAHGQLHGDRQALLQRRLALSWLVAYQRRAFGRPDFFVGLGGLRGALGRMDR
jgi:hypothetical protein